MVEMPSGSNERRTLTATSAPQPNWPSPPPDRKVGFLLGLGIFLLPFFFVWPLLRSGHSTLARVLGFGWAGLWLLTSVIGSLQPGEPAPAPAAPAATTPAPQLEPPAAPLTGSHADVMRFPADYLQLTPTVGVLAGRYASFRLRGELSNDSDLDIRNPTITCFIHDDAGKLAATANISLKGVVPAKDKIGVGDVNVRLGRQVAMSRYQCSVVDAEAVAP